MRSRSCSGVHGDAHAAEAFQALGVGGAEAARCIDDDGDFGLAQLLDLLGRDLGGLRKMQNGAIVFARRKGARPFLGTGKNDLGLHVLEERHDGAAVGAAGEGEDALLRSR